MRQTLGVFRDALISSVIISVAIRTIVLSKGERKGLLYGTSWVRIQRNLGSEAALEVERDRLV